jgi:hypothetical protein
MTFETWLELTGYENLNTYDTESAIMAWYTDTAPDDWYPPSHNPPEAA